MPNHWEVESQPSVEQRHMAAVTLIVKNSLVGHEPTEQMLVLRDKRIQETAAGLRVVSARATIGGSNWRWGIPGGGRHTDETYAETLQRELQEELGVECSAAELAVQLERLVAPFLMAQWLYESGTDRCSKITLLPLVTTVLSIDHLTPTAVAHLEQLERQQEVAWHPVAELSTIFSEIVMTHKPEVGDTHRLPILTAAFLYHSRAMLDTGVPELMNKLTHRYVMHEYGYQAPISNGVIDGTTGKVIGNTQAENEFIFGSSNV